MVVGLLAGSKVWTGEPSDLLGPGADGAVPLGFGTSMVITTPVPEDVGGDESGELNGRVDVSVSVTMTVETT